MDAAGWSTLLNSSPFLRLLERGVSGVYIPLVLGGKGRRLAVQQFVRIGPLVPHRLQLVPQAVQCMFHCTFPPVLTCSQMDFDKAVSDVLSPFFS